MLFIHSFVLLLSSQYFRDLRNLDDATRKYWKEGFASEAVERIKKFGFEDLKLEKLWAATHEENKASMQVMEKTRFYRVDDRPYHVEGVGDTKMRPHFELTKQVLNQPLQ